MEELTDLEAFLAANMREVRRMSRDKQERKLVTMLAAIMRRS